METIHTTVLQVCKQNSPHMTRKTRYMVTPVTRNHSAWPSGDRTLSYHQDPLYHGSVDARYVHHLVRLESWDLHRHSRCSALSVLWGVRRESSGSCVCVCVCVWRASKLRTVRVICRGTRHLLYDRAEWVGSGDGSSLCTPLQPSPHLAMEFTCARSHIDLYLS